MAASDHVVVDEMDPRVGFACLWRLDGRARYAFRVPSHDSCWSSAAR